MVWTQVCYQYDGSFAGFLSCVFDCYVNREEPVEFRTPNDPCCSLYPLRSVETREDHARRVYRSLALKMGKEGQRLDTVIGEMGMKLSGGEKQRLAIARALIREPRLLIFDEATSALDSLTEEQITDTVRRIAADRSQITILIAHRLSTIMHADTIYVLEKGRIHIAAICVGMAQRMLDDGWGREVPLEDGGSHDYQLRSEGG